MSGSIAATPPADVANLVCSVQRMRADVRIRVDGRVGSTCDLDHLRTAVRTAAEDTPERIVVDLNGVEGLDASVVEAIVALRGEASGTVIAIDISRLHGPALLTLLARLLDPGDQPTISRPRPTWP